MLSRQEPALELSRQEPAQSRQVQRVPHKLAGLRVSRVYRPVQLQVLGVGRQVARRVLSTQD